MGWPAMTFEPLMVKPSMVTGLSVLMVKMPCVWLLGPLSTDSAERVPFQAIPALAPARVNCVPIVRPAETLYAPASTLTVSPAEAALIPSWMLGAVVPPGTK